MSLLLPETGLLFWMLLAFGVVFFVLAKYGWPVISRMVDKRSDYINNSVIAAEETYRKLEDVRLQSEALIAEAHRKQLEILHEASDLKKKLLEDARIQALKEANQIVEEGKLSIQKEREEALREIRNQVTTLSVDIAAKILRQQLSDSESQQQLVQRILDESVNGENIKN